jgi:sporulation protein YlmC with PRC-barrel domain
VLLSTATLLGSDVKNPQGEDIGDLQHLMIDPQSGRVIYAVVSMGSVLGMGGKTVQVPWEALGVARDGTTLVLNASQALVPPAAGDNKGEATAVERAR